MSDFTQKVFVHYDGREVTVNSVSEAVAKRFDGWREKETAKSPTPTPSAPPVTPNR